MCAGRFLGVQSGSEQLELGRATHEELAPPCRQRPPSVSAGPMTPYWQLETDRAASRR